MEAIDENRDKTNETNESEGFNRTKERKDDNNEDINEETNKDNSNEDNNNEETNEDNGEENTNLFSTVFGEEEDREDGLEDNEDEEEYEERSEAIVETKANINKQIERTRDSDNNHSKRKSSESDGSETKRIKAEPIDKPVTTGDRRLTTTCEAIEVEESEQVLVEIPKNSFEYMNYLLDLNTNDLLNKDLKDIEMFPKLQNISNRFEFEDLNSFRNAFIPYILMDLWLKIKEKYIERQNSGSKARELKHLYSILTKSKTSKIKKGLEIRCISPIRSNETPVFKFGQLVTIQTAVQSRPNSSVQMISRKKYFGYVTGHVIRGFNSDNQSEVNHLKLMNEEKRNSILIEELVFMLKFSDEIYMRNDALIVIEPLLSIHNYYMEVRAVFKFEQFPIWRQVLTPIYSSRASGVLANTNRNKFEEIQIECIQIALDVVANPPNNSCFMAINGPKGSGKTSLLFEVLKQIVVCDRFKQSKVLFTSSSDSCLRSIEQKLKSNRITYYLVDNNPQKLTQLAIKQINHIMSKTNDDEKRNLYEQCLQYFESNMTYELSPETALFKNLFFEKFKIDLMSKSSVLIGRIDDLCNDISFYNYFANNNYFNSCIIDDAIDISEPQLYSLFWFGINKFIISADILESNCEQTDICRSFGLSRSFFERYYSLGSQNSQIKQTVNSTICNI